MVGSWSPRTLTGPSTTSSRRRGTPGTRTGSSKSIRSWCGRWWPRRRLRRRPWSRPRIVGLGRAGVAHLVERNLPKVEVAGSRPVARSTYLSPRLGQKGSNRISRNNRYGPLAVLTTCVQPGQVTGHAARVSRSPRLPPELTRGPFDLETARRYGLTRQQLRAAAWERLGGGFYAWREIAASPIVRLTAA